MNTISVVIPLYNKEAYIERALRSVSEQSTKIDEVIIVDDGSTDKSIQVLDILKDKISHKLISLKKNMGVSHARNLGVSHSSSDYVCFLDADDYWLPDFVKKMHSVILSNKHCSLLSVGYKYKTKGGYQEAKVNVKKNTGLLFEKIEDYFSVALSGDLPVTSSSVCVKKTCFIKSGGFDESQAMGEDQLLWARLSYSEIMIFVPEILSVYDISVTDSACRAVDKTIVPSYVNELVKDVELNLAPRRLHPSIKRYVNRSYKYAALQSLMAGDKKKARKLLSSATKSLDSQIFVLSILLMFPVSISERFSVFIHNLVNKKNAT